ncbi:MAG: ATP-binding cassette domain-containing protein [Actinomycetota bacterium]|nr:ATP-binding cassette domain-containing protein [Actinomycetota bacterium]
MNRRGEGQGKATAAAGAGERSVGAASTDRQRSALAPGELAEAAIMADLAIGLQVLGWLLPFGAAVQAMATVPLVALAVRHRSRAVLVGTLAGATLAMLVAGITMVIQTAMAGALALAVATGIRRRWGLVRTTVVSTFTAGSTIAIATLVTIAVLPGLRKLSLAQVMVIWRGLYGMAGRVGAAGPMEPVNTWVVVALRDWWLSIPVATALAVGVVGALTWMVAVPTLARLEAATGGSWPALHSDRHRTGAIAPVPVKLVDAGFRYPGAARAALEGVNLAIEQAGLTAVVGGNGSGKSTLVRVLAGLQPTSGTVEREGRAGLGEPGGTAVVFQRPESQVIGVTVTEDLGWGLAPGALGGGDALLDLVGLGGLGDLETSTLSGGQLQRLAIAAALSRRPGLLLSDESTAMLDPAGRRDVMTVLARLATEHRVSVLHVSHLPEEAAVASTAVTMEEGRVTGVGYPPEVAVVGTGQLGDRSRAAVLGAGERLRRTAVPPLLELRSVGVVHAAGTPWSRRALADVDLSVDRGEGLVVLGRNGSGKSSLAWVLAGLRKPTEGMALLGGAPLHRQVGRVGLAFQQPRLQLFRDTVVSELSWGRSSDRATIVRSLERVGLEPATYLDRRVDALSGGEQRRVVLAGILARNPAVVVLDEPFAGLDSSATESVTAALAALRRSGTATVVISHEEATAADVGCRRITIDGGRVTRDEPLE